MTQMGTADGIQGFTAPGFEAMHGAFGRAAAFDRRGGSALSVFRDGELVVELVAGSGSDDSTPRTTSTTQTMFSCTKGVVAVALLLLIERGELDLDAPVARYWPEFGANGKGGLLVRQVVSHMAAQPAFRTPIAIEDLADDELLERVIAADEAWWEPGTALAYHSITFGPLCGGLVRRIAGESVGSFVAREIATPLGLDLWIGLPREREQDVAPLHDVPDEELDPPIDHPAARARATNPMALAGPGRQTWNSSLYHAAEIPAAGGISTATALAKLYACMALGGTLDGQQLLRPETIELGRSELSVGPDILTPDWIARFGVGWSLKTPDDPDWLDPLAFGHDGYGGQASGAWPTHRTSFAYFTTALRGGDAGDERMGMVLSALAQTLAAT
jgi:CubicO group peptidase (beta-lactamase class C family)